MHSDVAGKIKPRSLGGAQYVVSFIDEFSRYATVFLLKKKSEVFEKFTIFQAQVENFHECKIRIFQSDNGGEYVNLSFKDLFGELGITHRRTVAANPEQNGISERYWLTLFNAIRCMLIQSGVPKEFWGEAMKAAVFILNRIPHSGINFQIPYELWFKRKFEGSEVQRIKVFGCKAWALKMDSGKLEEKTEACVMMGYELETKDGYRLWSLERQTIIVRRNVVFDEDVFPFKAAIDKVPKIIERNVNCIKSKTTQYVNTDDDEGEDVMMIVGDQDVVVDDNVVEGNVNENENLEYDEAGSENVSEELDVGQEIRRSCRMAKPKVCGCCNIVTVDEALSSSDAEKWRDAMHEEIKTMERMDVWDIVERPEGKVIVGSRWVFTIKRDSEGKSVSYKARLVAQGFKNKLKLRYEETSSPVMKRKTMRLLIAIAVKKGWDIEQIDVKGAYLHSPINCEIFMEQPRGYEVNSSKKFVCKLKKSIYGLPNSSKDWNVHADSLLVNKLGFTRSIVEPCVYVKDGVIVGLYVDDAMLIGNFKAIQEVKDLLAKELEIKDLGSAQYLLSIKVERFSHGIALSQISYIEEVLAEFNMNQNIRPTYTILPSDHSDKKIEAKTDDDDVDSYMYRSAVGSLLYIATNTRPDIAFAVGLVSQKNQCPKVRDWKNVKHIFRYLYTTKDLKLLFKSDNISMSVYCDADWGADKKTRKSISGFVLRLAGGAITWHSRKQSCVARSTLEAEYISMSEVTKEVEWISNLFQELKQESMLDKPCKILADNASAIKLSLNNSIGEGSKHIDIMYHNCKDLVKKGVVKFEYVPSAENVADIFTKNLSRVKLEKFRESLGVMRAN